MQYWKAHYIDALHDTDIEILNTEEDYSTDPLSFVLDGITFRGTGPADFHLADGAQYEEACRKFCLLRWGGHNTKYQVTSPYIYDLQRYALEVEIPVSIFRKSDKRLIRGNLRFAFRYTAPDMSKPHTRVLCDDTIVYRDDPTVLEFSIFTDGNLYRSGRMTLWFDVALGDICRQMQDRYCLMSCFTCQYSDYSPYGSDDFGMMLCYCRHKEECLKVNSKDDYFAFLEDKDFDGRQETYLCSQYSPRNQAGGYRGYVGGTCPG